MCFSINFNLLANIRYVVCYKDYEMLEDHEVCSERKRCLSLDLGRERVVGSCWLCIPWAPGTCCARERLHVGQCKVSPQSLQTLTCRFCRSVLQLSLFVKHFENNSETKLVWVRNRRSFLSKWCVEHCQPWTFRHLNCNRVEHRQLVVGGRY